jgi:hypothetical protein
VAVLEDLHWADEATLDFLRFIGRRIQRTGALLIVTYREEELPLIHPVRLAIGELTGQHIIRMRLPPLTISAVADLSQETRWNAATLLRITGGNPFFLREVLTAGDQIPSSVRDAVLSRLMRASAKVRETAELLSISPGRTANWIIESVLGPQADAIHEGVTRGLFQNHADAVAFRHELARLAVYSSLPPARARGMHLRLLHALADHGGADLVEIVHHATLADDVAALLLYAPQAARQSARLGAHREAVAHFEAALRHAGVLPGAARAALLEEYAGECSSTNQSELAIRASYEALELWRAAAIPEAQSRVLSFLANEHRTTGDKMRTDDCIRRAITLLLEPLPHSAMLAFAYQARARIASHRGLVRRNKAR